MDVNGNYFPMRAGDIETLGVDFSTCATLNPGETILSATWSMNTAGLSPINTAYLNGFLVSQQVLAVTAGTYYPTCTAVTSLGNRITLPDPGRGMLQVV